MNLIVMFTKHCNDPRFICVYITIQYFCPDIDLMELKTISTFVNFSHLKFFHAVGLGVVNDASPKPLVMSGAEDVVPAVLQEGLEL